MKITIIAAFIGLGLLQGVSRADAAFQRSGSADIDVARKAVATTPTTAQNHRERCLLLFMWLGALQQQAADTRSFFELDREYYRLEPQVNRLKDGQQSPALKQMCDFVDRAFKAMEEIQTSLVENGPIFKPFEGDPNNAPKGGDMDADWPTFRHNEHNTGYTPAPGPATGREAWRFPVGLGFAETNTTTGSFWANNAAPWLLWRPGDATAANAVVTWLGPGGSGSIDEGAYTVAQAGHLAAFSVT